ncbi:pentatricopeptide repeat-containing protein At1g08070, chloroplastic-like [Silene latifolia]|uniref:pentatricopeptide repeat-containing protein At1g08070, chloroplastic-like n=1 Tax=Silene latifolia TaxID=37657 RepID=UPI003D7885A9
MDLQVLNFLGKSLNINQLKQIHTLILTKFNSIAPIYPRFVEELLNLSHPSYARKVFDVMPKREERLYDAFITAYTKQCSYREALGMFNSMRSEITRVPIVTLPPVLKCCSALFMLGLGKQVHALIIKCGFESDCLVENALLDLYAKSSDLVSAKFVFDDALDRDPTMYDILISGYSSCGDDVAAKMLFDQMPEKTDVSWNSMITCYARSGKLHDAMRMFEKMQLEKFQPNERSLTTVLTVCASLGDLDMGLKLKKYIDDNNMSSDMTVSTALLDMFLKCGAVNEARQVFDRMKEKDIVTWGSMVAGYAQNGRSVEALTLFERMKRQQIKPNDVTLVGVLSACAKLGSVKTGEELGNYIKVGGFDSNVSVAAALLAMYSRCRNMKKAWQVFDRIDEKNVMCWNSMISGLAFNGYAGGAINLFFEMEKLCLPTSSAGEVVEGGTDDGSFKSDCLNTATLAPYAQKKETNKTSLKPDTVTFASLLTACTHVGLVGMGLEYFNSMRKDYNIVPQIEHYACIVDLFCRSGELNEAYEFICQMEDPPNAVIWSTLLSCCRKNSNVELAEVALKKLIELEPENSANYVLLSNIYADAGRWQDSLQVRNLMKAKKSPEKYCM